MFDRLLKYLFGDDNTHEHDFGIWEIKNFNYTRPAKDIQEVATWGGIFEKEFNQAYQQRQCKTCGYAEQRELKYQ